MLLDLSPSHLLVSKQLILDRPESHLDLLSLLLNKHAHVISLMSTYPNPDLMLSILIIFLVRNLNIPEKCIFLLLLLDLFALLAQLAQAFIELFLLFFEFLLSLLQKVLSVDRGHPQLLLLFQLLRLNYLQLFLLCLLYLLLLYLISFEFLLNVLLPLSHNLCPIGQGLFLEFSEV
jgi:hypothetical protein